MLVGMAAGRARAAAAHWLGGQACWGGRGASAGVLVVRRLDSVVARDGVARFSSTPGRSAVE